GDGDRAVHLFERDCSLQRRHQKVIEEAPAPGMTKEMRAAMGTAAVRAAEAIGYKGAGTVEFIVDGSDGLRPDGFYFMEMNTRLQVEHPVTEMVTGVDIVREQLRIAAGGALGFSQDGVAIEGHAIECRINAEDPSDGFRPTPGVLTAFDVPADRGPGRIRVDTHVSAGAEVPPYYDSLIAKVIAHAASRDEAIETMVRALSAATIEGVSTTIPLHLAVLGSDEFRSGNYDTRTIPGWTA
ncbi:MAG: hypothetical protein AAGG01_14070, partial [Planctomycetota bacterium]